MSLSSPLAVGDVGVSAVDSTGFGHRYHLQDEFSIDCLCEGITVTLVSS